MFSSLPTTFITLLALAPFYLIGAYPTGYFIARRLGVDVLAAGSGNPGATNVARVAGIKAGLLTLAGDLLKGLGAVMLAGLLWHDSALAAFSGAATVAGHCFSIPGRLRGGKGVSTSLGVLLGIEPMAGFFAVLVFAVVLTACRIVSVASLMAAFTAPLVALAGGAADPILGSMMLISAIVIYRHRSNLFRLTMGTEKKFSFGR